METLPRPITADELDQMPDDGMRYEVIAGELHVAAAPLKEHQRFLARLNFLVYQAVVLPDWGEVFFAPVDVRFPNGDQVQPDLIVLRKDRLDLYQGNKVFGAPDVVVEILSPSNRPYDEVTKARLYAEFGVPEYWIGDPLAPNLRLFALRGGVYVPIAPEHGLLRSTVVPNLTVDPAALLVDLSK